MLIKCGEAPRYRTKLSRQVIMLRTTITRPILKSLSKASPTRSTYDIATIFTNVSTKYRSLSNKRPRAIASSPFRQTTTSLLRYATAAKPPYDRIDKDSERKILEQTIQSHPDAVSGASSVRHVFEGKGVQKKDHDDADMLGGIRADLVCSFQSHHLCVVA